MEREVSKKTGVALLLVGVIISIMLTFGILNYFQTSKVVDEGVEDSISGGDISLTLKKQPNIKDEEAGSVSLILVP